MKAYRWILAILLASFLFGCAKGGTHLIRVQYQPVKEFPSIAVKVGSTLGLVPIKDERPEQLYVGRHASRGGVTSFFKSDPLPLHQAMMDSISHALSRYGVKTIPVSDWDGKPGSMKMVGADSVLMIELKKFWIEGQAIPFRTNVKTSVHLVIHLGVNKEGKVFTRNIEVEKEATLARLTPERVEDMVNQTLTDIFDGYFSNPY